jgi:hypothetical protein
MKVCCVCGLDVPALIERAHVPDRKTAPDHVVHLCCTCHRAFDLGLLHQAEVEQAWDCWQKGEGAAYANRPEALRELWHSREADWSILQKDAQKRGGRTIRNRKSAERAWNTRRRNMADK